MSLNHHDVNVVLYDGRLDGRCLCDCSLCVPMYQFDVVSRAFCRRLGRSCFEHGGSDKGRFQNLSYVNNCGPEEGAFEETWWP